MYPRTRRIRMFRGFLVVGLVCASLAPLRALADTIARAASLAESRAADARISGTWQGTLLQGMSPWHEVINLSQTGSSVTGTRMSTSQDGSQVVTWAINGSFNANVLRFTDSSVIRQSGGNNFCAISADLTYSAANGVALLQGNWNASSCGGGSLNLAMREGVSGAIKPSGTWLFPKQNGVTIRDNWLHLAAIAHSTHQGDPGIDHVNFTAWWPGVNPTTWYIPPTCSVYHPTAGTRDIYECDWNLAHVPNGPLSISFDVYDKRGHKNLAPQGTHYGLIRRPAIPDGTLVKGSGSDVFVVYDGSAYRIPDQATLDTIEARSTASIMYLSAQKLNALYHGKTLPSVDAVQLDLQPPSTADSSAQLKQPYLRVHLSSEQIATAALTALSTEALIMNTVGCLAPEVPLAGVILVAPEATAYLTLVNISLNPSCLGLAETMIEHATNEDGAFAVGP